MIGSYARYNVKGKITNGWIDSVKMEQDQIESSYAYRSVRGLCSNFALILSDQIIQLGAVKETDLLLLSLC